MEIQTCVAPAELWLRDDLEEVYGLLFRFFGQKFVIVVPDPIGFAPWRVLLDPGELCDICQHTSPQQLFAGLLSHKEQRRHERWRSHGSTVAQPLRLY